MIKNIYFFASFGDFKQIPKGGGQTSARRLLNVLRQKGFCVTTLPRTYTVNPVIKYLAFIFDPIRVFFSLLLKQRKNSCFLIIAYSGHLFPFYFFIVKMAKFIGYKTVVYVKGGFTEKKLDAMKIRYRNSFINGLNYTDLLMSEGEEGVMLARRYSDKVKTLYLPNYIEDGFGPSACPVKPAGEINIIYFGRISEDKNVLLCVEIFNLLAERYKDLTLTIVGGGRNKSYEKKVQAKITESEYKSRISFRGRVDHKALSQILATQHLFIFPSSEKQEGHSNSLNEAMAWGLVPVVSNNNFLPSIVGNERLVVESYNPKDYAECISTLIESRSLENLSKTMYQRVQDKFTQETVQYNLQKEIAEL